MMAHDWYCLNKILCDDCANAEKSTEFHRYELLHAIHRFERVFGNRKSTLS